MDVQLLIIAAVALLCAVFVGSTVARRAAQRETIYSGALAQAFNLIAAMALAATAPMVLTAIILGRFHQVVPMAIGLLVTSLLASLLFAFVELPAHKRVLVSQQTDEELWTAEKARTSGL